MGIEQTSNSVIRVANIIEESRMGGPQFRMIRVASSLSNSVDTVVVMPVENSKDFRDACRQQKIQYKTIKITRLSRGWLNLVKYIFCSPIEIYTIYKFLKINNFDLVHISGGSWQYRGAIAGRIAGIKVLWHLNDTSMPLYIRMVFKALSPLAEAYIYASIRSSQYYKYFVTKGKKEFIIPAPVDTKLFNPENDFIECISLSNRGEKIIIGMVANVSPVKGIETYIKVISELNKEFNNLNFILVGNTFKSQASYFKKLKHLMEFQGVENLEFLGEQKNISDILKVVDIYLCTSNAESSPISVWEAMSMSKPIISTDVGDVSQYITDGYNGYIVKVGDYLTIAKRARELILNSELRQIFGQRSREVAVNNLSLVECAKKHLEAYRICLAG